MANQSSTSGNFVPKSFKTLTPLLRNSKNILIQKSFFPSLKKNKGKTCITLYEFPFKLAFENETEKSKYMQSFYGKFD